MVDEWHTSRRDGQASVYLLVGRQSAEARRVGAVFALARETRRNKEFGAMAGTRVVRVAGGVKPPM